MQQKCPWKDLFKQYDEKCGQRWRPTGPIGEESMAIQFGRFMNTY